MPRNESSGVKRDNHDTSPSPVYRTPMSTVLYEQSLSLLPFFGVPSRDLHSLLNPPFRILDLPEEISEQILILALYRPYHSKPMNPLWSTRKFYGLALSLSLTCKTFRRMVVPSLYSSLVLSFDSKHHKLIRTLESKPDLARYCRTLHFGLPQHYSDTDVILDDDRNRGDSSRACGCQDEHGIKCVWKTVASTLTMMTCMEELTIGFGFLPEQVCIQSLFEILTPLRHLKRLSLGDWGKRTRCGKVCTNPLFRRRMAATRPEHTLILRQELRSLGNIASIELHTCIEVEDLLAWPAKLEHFGDLGGFCVGDFNADSFRCALSPHRESLKSLTLGGCTWTRPIRVHEFINLESICLAVSTLTVNWSPREFNWNILSAPRLQRLTWDFYKTNARGSYDVRCCDFGFLMAGFLRHLASLASEDNRALREMEILFYPWSNRCCSGRYSKDALGHLDGVSKELQSLGMRLICERYRIKKVKRRGGDNGTFYDIVQPRIRSKTASTKMQSRFRQFSRQY
jgi:hypothetical protein